MGNPRSWPKILRIFLEFLFPGADMILGHSGHALKNDRYRVNPQTGRPDPALTYGRQARFMANYIRQRSIPANLAMTIRDQANLSRNRIDGTVQHYRSSYTIDPGASNYYTLFVAENMQTKLNAMSASLDSQRPVVDVYSYQTIIHSSVWFEIIPVIYAYEAGGSFTPQSGSSDPLNVQTVIEAAMAAGEEHRILILDPIQARPEFVSGADLDFVAKVNVDLTLPAAAWLARNNRAEWTDDDMGYIMLGLLYHTVGTAATASAQRFVRVAWHAE